MVLRAGYDSGRLNSLADEIEAETSLALTEDSLIRGKRK